MNSDGDRMGLVSKEPDLKRDHLRGTTGSLSAWAQKSVSQAYF